MTTVNQTSSHQKETRQTFTQTIANNKCEKTKAQIHRLLKLPMLLLPPLHQAQNRGYEALDGTCTQ